MNNKFLVLVLILCGLTLSALMVKNGEVLLLALPFLIYLIVGAVQAPSEVNLVAERIISKPIAIAQALFEIQVVIRNQGNTVVNLTLTDELFPSMIILDGKANSRISLPGGDLADLDYAAKAARGVYYWKLIKACASDPFGLFELKRDIPASGEILVRPRSVPVQRSVLKPRSTLHTAGPIPARVAGSGTDYWGIREYRAGDPLRQLNWRLVARHPHRLFTNEYEQEEITDFGLILDARRKTDDDVMEEELFDHSVSAAASLSEHFLKKGNRVSLLVFGEGYTCLFPGYGKKQLNLVMRNLARARLGRNLSLRYLQYFPVRLFPSRSQIVVISVIDSRDLETYATLRAFGYDVLLISPDPVEYSARKLPQTKLNNLAVRAARIERVVPLKQLSKMGVEIVDWQVNQSLETIIQKSTRLINHRRIFR